MEPKLRPRCGHRRLYELKWTAGNFSQTGFAWKYGNERVPFTQAMLPGAAADICGFAALKWLISQGVFDTIDDPIPPSGTGLDREWDVLWCVYLELGPDGRRTRFVGDTLDAALRAAVSAAIGKRDRRGCEPMKKPHP